MAGITKVNPAATTTNVEMVGKDLVFLTVDYVNAVNGSAGPSGAQQAVLNQLQNVGTIVAIGPLADSNTQQTFAFEGFSPGPGYTGSGALEYSITSLGTVDGVDLSTATVRATKLAILTAAVVSP